MAGRPAMVPRWRRRPRNGGSAGARKVTIEGRLLPRQLESFHRGSYWVNGLKMGMGEWLSMGSWFNHDTRASILQEQVRG